MKPLLVIAISYLLILMVFDQMSGLTLFAGVFWMFTLAFFDNLLAKKNTLVVVAAFSLWSMIDETVPWAVAIMRSILGNLGSSLADVRFQIDAFFTIFVISGTFVGLLGWNLLELHIAKYLVRRWKLNERCAQNLAKTRAGQKESEDIMSQTKGKKLVGKIYGIFNRRNRTAVSYTKKFWGE